MNRLIRLMLILVMGLMLVVPTAYAEYEDGFLPVLEIEASGTLDVYSRYVWRGFTLDGDDVVQPGFNLSGYGLTLSFWSSFDADSNDGANSDEVDFVIDYTKEFEDFSVSAGHTNYDFPGAAAYSKEWYVGTAFDVIGSPTITYYQDYGKEENGGADGSYLNLGVSHSFTVFADPEITLDLGASIGFNDKLFIVGEGGDYLITAGVTVPLTKSLSMSPVMGYTIPFGDLEDANDGNQKNRFYTGLSLGFGF